MKNSVFQITILAVFVIFAILAIVIFSGFLPIGKTNQKDGGVGTVVIWGTASVKAMNTVIDPFNAKSETYKIKYIERDPKLFDEQLIEAIAGGVGPDIILLPQVLLLRYQSKLFPVPYQ